MSDQVPNKVSDQVKSKLAQQPSDGSTEDGKKPFLSIIVPAYNEQERLPGTLQRIDRWIATFGRAVELVVVENGSTDGTVEVVRRFQDGHDYVRLIADVPKGKGRAVREGMLAARGQFRFLCDADLSMPIDLVTRFLPPECEEADVAIGSREAPGARRLEEPGYRHLMGRVYNLLVKLIALPGLEDSQCGFKMFRARAAEDVFRASKLHGWGFDPEVLYIARKRGYVIREVPIDWHFNDDSRVRPVHDTVAMVRELVSIRTNDWRGEYDE